MFRVVLPPIIRGQIQSVKQSPSWEADSFLASRGIPRILWIVKFRHRVYKSPTLDPILSQINPFHSPPPYFLIHFPLSTSKGLSKIWGFFLTMRKMCRFLEVGLLAPRPTPKAEDHSLSAVSYCLYITSWGTRRCPGWPMAKPDIICLLIKPKRLNNLWTCVNVICAPCHARKTPVLNAKHTNVQ
jgi:hypothetical protein